MTEYKAHYFIGLPILSVNWLEPPSVLHKVEYVLHRFHGLFNNWGLRPHLNVGICLFKPSECCNKITLSALKTLKSRRGRKYSPYNLCSISRSVGGKWNNALKKGDILKPFILDRPAVPFFFCLDSCLYQTGLCFTSSQEASHPSSKTPDMGTRPFHWKEQQLTLTLTVRRVKRDVRV